MKQKEGKKVFLNKDLKNSLKIISNSTLESYDFDREFDIKRCANTIIAHQDKKIMRGDKNEKCPSCFLILVLDIEKLKEIISYTNCSYNCYGARLSSNITKIL